MNLLQRLQKKSSVADRSLFQAGVNFSSVFTLEFRAAKTETMQEETILLVVICLVHRTTTGFKLCNKILLSKSIIVEMEGKMFLVNLNLISYLGCSSTTQWRS